MTNQLAQLYIHPIFSFITKNFTFNLVGLNMMSMPLFQDLLTKNHAGKFSEIEISAKNELGQQFMYNVGDILASYNTTVGLKLNGIDGKVQAQLVEVLKPLCRLTAISLFDVLDSSSYNNDVNRSILYQFSKHIRNGAAHNNRFNISPPLTHTVTWRDKEINNSSNGKEVFLSFLSAGDLMLLINDISLELKKIDEV